MTPEIIPLTLDDSNLRKATAIGLLDRRARIVEAMKEPMPAGAVLEVLSELMDIDDYLESMDDGCVTGYAQLNEIGFGSFGPM